MCKTGKSFSQNHSSWAFSFLLCSKVQGSGNHSTPLTCYYHLFICIMKLELNDPTIRYTIHSPFDVISDESIFIEIGPTEEIQHTFMLSETTWVKSWWSHQVTMTKRKLAYHSNSLVHVAHLNDKEFKFTTWIFNFSAHEKLKKLSVHQRKCLFYDEEFMPGIVGYNVNFCKLKCRAEAALKLCNCRPHFYKFISEYCSILTHCARLLLISLLYDSLVHRESEKLLVFTMKNEFSVFSISSFPSRHIRRHTMQSSWPRLSFDQLVA